MESKGVIMNINEKVALYDYCRRRVGKEFYNLSSKKKESVKRQYYKTRPEMMESELSPEKRKFGMKFNFPDSLIKNLVLQN